MTDEPVDESYEWEVVITLDGETRTLDEAREHVQSLIRDLWHWQRAVHEAEKQFLIGTTDVRGAAELADVHVAAIVNAIDAGDLTAVAAERGHERLARGDVAAWQLVREIAEADL